MWIPAGTFQVNRHIVVDDVTIEGAGSWWSIVEGHQVSLSDGLTAVLVCGQVQQQGDIRA